VVVDRSPTVGRRRLGIELRRLREKAGLMIEDVATHLECSSSKVSRIETDKAIPRVRDVRDMLQLYEVTATQAHLLLTSRSRSSTPWPASCHDRDLNTQR
jgi:transcriptional regulator with XRE-family HTH domain